MKKVYFVAIVETEESKYGWSWDKALCNLSWTGERPAQEEAEKHFVSDLLGVSKPKFLKWIEVEAEPDIKSLRRAVPANYADVEVR